jgi:hypothetical protein
MKIALTQKIKINNIKMHEWIVTCSLFAFVNNKLCINKPTIKEEMRRKKDSTYLEVGSIWERSCSNNRDGVMLALNRFLDSFFLFIWFFSFSLVFYSFFFFSSFFFSAFFFFPLSNFLVQTNPISNPKKSLFFFWVFRF